MTEDYKEKLLKWVSGNYDIETGSDEPQFTTPISRTNNFNTLFSAQFPDGYFLASTLQGYNANNNGVGYTIITGSYVDGTANNNLVLKGFLSILDNDFDIVQTMTTYSNGEELGIFEAINVGDDGNFFAIEKDQDGKNKKLVLLNNIIAKLPSETEYKIVLRKRYTVPNTTKLYSSLISGIIKAPGMSKYCVYGDYTENPNHKPLVTEIAINVGSENTWTDYKYSGAVEFYATDCLPNWDSSGNLSFKMVGIQNVGGETKNYSFYMYLANGSTSMTRKPIGTALGVGNTMDIKILTADDIYGSFGNYGVVRIYKVDTELYTLNNFYSKTIPVVQYRFNSGIKIIKNGTELFYSITANVDTTPAKDKYYFGKVVGTNAYEYDLGEFTADLTTLFSVQKQFNMYDYYMQIGDVVYDMKQVYNPLNYNGIAYQALDSMVANSVNVYNPSGVVIFTRNLYNRIINNNTTIATVEIPNDYLNDITIKLKELMSKTNNIMVSDEMEVTKNIYEELFVNFVNSILVKDSNNPNNITINNIASSRINKSISDPLVLDYDDSKIGKYRINYTNGESTIYTIDTNLTYTDLSTTYKITVYVPLEYGIKNIQILSNDEATIYQIIDCSNLEKNKYYTIKQKMEVV